MHHAAEAGGIAFSHSLTQPNGKSRGVNETTKPKIAGGLDCTLWSAKALMAEAACRLSNCHRGGRFPAPRLPLGLNA
jgi:hypothetical protein